MKRSQKYRTENDKINKLAKTDNWDGHQEVKELIEKIEPLKDLYKKLGYSPYVDKKSKQLLDELHSLIRMEILGISKSNFAEFQKALVNLQEYFENNGKDEKKSMSATELEYWGKMFKNKDDYKKVLELLNENQIWKTYLSYYDYLLTKKGRLADRGRFLALLDELEKLFNKSWLPQRKEVYEDILHSIAGVRDEIDDADDFLDAEVLGSLECEVESVCVTLSHDEVTEEKKRKLDDLLWNLRYVRHKYGPADSYFMDVAKEQAKTYLDAPWMHLSWLTKYFLSHLLEAEIARLQIKPLSGRVVVVTVIGVGLLFYFKLAVFAWLWITTLILWFFFFIRSGLKTKSLLPIHEEVVSGHYDGEELARRLRKMEDKGLYIQSIIYSLLHL